MHLLQSFCLPPALQRALVRIKPPAPGGVRQPGRAWWVLAVGAWLFLLGTAVPALAQSDATLSGLTVSPEDITGFDSAKTEYAVGVANNITDATVTPTANDTGASITINDTAVTSGNGHQVTLAEGHNVVSIEVTTADTTTKKTYTVTIVRFAPYVHKLVDDFDTLNDLNRGFFRDITSDGTTMWVASPGSDATVYAFNMQTKARDADKDIAVHSLTTGANSNPWGLWTNDETMWVAQRSPPSRVFVYTFVDGSGWSRASERDIDAITRPAGMWSDGQTLWVVDTGLSSIAPKISAYTLSNGQPDEDLNFNTLDGANADPKGIWSDGEIMWVADSSDTKLYAYDMLTKAQVPAKDFPPTNQLNHPVRGIWSDGQTMWVENPNKTDGFIRSYVMPQSDSTRLRFVHINGKEIDLAQTNPTHYVANTKTQVTVEAEALHFQAQAAITSHNDADDMTDGHQVALSGSSTDITITVTAQDGTTGTHTVTVTKIARPGKPTITEELTAAHESLTVAWNAPTGVSGITAYDVRYRRTTPTDSKWKTKKDIWQSGRPLSYEITGLTNNREYEVQVRAVINGVSGEWSDSKRETPEAASSDATLSGLTVSPEDITGFDSAKTEYAVGVANNIIDATVTPTAKDTGASITINDTAFTSGSGYPVNLRVGGNEVSIVVIAADTTTKKTYTVIINRESTDTYGWKVLTDIDLSKTTAPRGIWSDGTTLWVADDDDDDLEAYDLETGGYIKRIDLDSSNNQPGDIWSDGEIMWVAEFDPPKVYAYDLATGDRKEDRDIDELDPNQRTAWDIWSDGETIWVNPHGGGKLYAYDPATGDRKAGKDITLSSAGDRGMWSDGETLWMLFGSGGDGRMASYLLSSYEPISAESSRELAGANDKPWGIWSDAETLYVADEDDDKVYTYNVPKSANAELKSLSLSPVDMDIDFDAATTEYDIDVAATVSQVTVAAKPLQRWAKVTITPADADTTTDGYQVNLIGTSTDITIRVTAHDGTPSSDTYTVTVDREASDDPDPDPPSTDATLSRLTLSAGRLNPTFASGTDTYTAKVGYTVKQLTVTPTATDGSATITIDGTEVTSGSGHPVDLNNMGSNIIEIEVKAEDETTKTYTVTVTHTAADLSLTPSDADPEAVYDSTAVYTVTFKGEWTTAVTPDRVPAGAHFSRLIGAMS